MNSIKKLVADFDDLFIKFFMQGFIFIADLATNHDLMKQVRKAALNKMQEKKTAAASAQENPSAASKQLSTSFLLLTLLHGSKTHIVFKDFKDVNSFFESMGVKPLLKDQPSSKELIDEFKTDFKLDELLEKLPFLDFLLQNVDASSVVVGVNLPKTLLTVNLRLTGLGDLVQYIVKK